MWQRIQTALILVLIVGLAMFASSSPYLFIAMLIVGIALAAQEWTQFLPKPATNTSMVHTPTFYVATVLVINVVSLAFPVTWVGWWLASIIVWLFAVIWIRQYPKKISWFDARLTLVGVILMTAAMTAMFYLWSLSPWWLMYVFVLVWSADTGAYFVGRKFGKHKMAPSVSPNKSMEGLFGGLATGLIAVLLVVTFKLDYTGLALVLFVLLSLLTIIASVFGDLLESMFKRQVGIKDSGSILPGHGGILDRIDSQLSAMPIFALGYWAIQQFII